MVLQREAPIPVWGTAAPGEEVTVTFGAQKKTATSAADGTWRVTLDPVPAGGPLELTVSGKNTLAFKDILAGEVWLCSGQSNMEMGLRGVDQAQSEIAASDFPKIRLFTVAKNHAPEPQRDLKGQWQVCGPRTVADFSGVAYLFGRDLHQALGVPVGLIHSSVGGTAAQMWISKRVVEQEPALKPVLDWFQQRVAGYPQALADFEKTQAAWQREAEKAKDEKRPAPKKPQKPRAPVPIGELYNGMIFPLMPFAIRGAAWYQGESDVGNPANYANLLPALVRSWRQAWGQGDFLFLIVQLPRIGNAAPEPDAVSGWAAVREVQLQMLSLPKVGLAVTIDTGGDLHPTAKQPVGARLALAARAVAYGQDLVSSGPRFERMTVADGKARLAFTHVGGGLTAKNNGPLKGFAIAGEDRRFVWAEARIDGSSVLVSSDGVAKPVAVRYAWADNPDWSLGNKEGLPASPFRTDAWGPPTP